jgi:hypothetical protein
MHEPDFWTNNAEAMEMTIEGNRLLAREIADMARGLWQRMVRGLDAAIQTLGHHRHQPPI